MKSKQNPLEILQNIPYLDEDFLREIAGIDWPDAMDILRRLGRSRGGWPPVNVVETANEIIVTAAIPGLRRSADLRVELKGNILTLEGEIFSDTQALAAATVHREERRAGKFKRTVTLPVAVNIRSAIATYRQGILKIRLAKLPDQVTTLAVDFGGS